MVKKPQLTITLILLSAMPVSLTVSTVKPAAIYPSIPPKCPVITVSCPTTDRPFTFTATMYDTDKKEKFSNQYVEYYWTLSKGKILQGQGTDTITVDGSSTDIAGLTATVDVRGLDSDCKTKASCTRSH